MGRHGGRANETFAVAEYVRLGGFPRSALLSIMRDLQRGNTETRREHSWSINLELPHHEVDRDLVVDEALNAIARTAAGYHVNLVTHETHGHPSTYLYDVLHDRFGSAVEFRYVAQCGCGGHTTRVRVRDEVDRR